MHLFQLDNLELWIEPRKRGKNQLTLSKYNIRPHSLMLLLLQLLLQFLCCVKTKKTNLRTIYVSISAFELYVNQLRRLKKLT